MKTYHRTCIKEFTREATNGTLHLVRGEKYITSRARDGEVMVFTNFWAWVPMGVFGKPKRFT